MRRKFWCWVVVWATLVLLAPVATAAPLAKITGCRLVKTDWADGDSFLVQVPKTDTHEARQITIRLYGVDCLETQARNESDARRIRAQRRYFGITTVGGSAVESIALAKRLGEEAKVLVLNALEKPFTVYTSFADARGSSRHKRYYGFIVTGDGRDLAEVLVSKGLARAFGVYRETYDHRHQKEYKSNLADLELQAAQRGVGVWKFTNWKKLPGERQRQRAEEREIEMAIDGKKKPPEGKVHINKASRDELMRVPGIGETMANRIIESRPYRKPEDLLRVKRIGVATLRKIQPYFEFPVSGGTN